MDEFETIARTLAALSQTISNIWPSKRGKGDQVIEFGPEDRKQLEQVLEGMLGVTDKLVTIAAENRRIAERANFRAEAVAQILGPETAAYVESELAKAISEQDAANHARREAENE